MYWNFIFLLLNNIPCMPRIIYSQSIAHSYLSGYYEDYCCEHSCVRFGMSPYFHFSCIGSWKWSFWSHDNSANLSLASAPSHCSPGNIRGNHCLPPHQRLAGSLSSRPSWCVCVCVRSCSSRYLWFVALQWQTMLNIFPCVHWPFVYSLGKMFTQILGPFLVLLSASCWTFKSSLYVLDTVCYQKHDLSCLLIFLLRWV